MLEAATTDRRSGFRYLDLCSVDAATRPQARTVVLRRVDIAARTLEFHTDTRSAKWQELGENPYASVLGFGADQQIQIRLQGEIVLHRPGSSKAVEAWGQLSDWTRNTYNGGPPGDVAPLETPDARPVSDLDNDGSGQSVFGLLLFRAAKMDWFQLQHPENRRALFEYDAMGTLTNACWVNP